MLVNTEDDPFASVCAPDKFETVDRGLYKYRQATHPQRAL